MADEEADEEAGWRSAPVPLQAELLQMHAHILPRHPPSAIRHPPLSYQNNSMTKRTLM